MCPARLYLYIYIYTYAHTLLYCSSFHLLLYYPNITPVHSKGHRLPPVKALLFPTPDRLPFFPIGYWGYIGIMEKTTEPAILDWGFIGIMGKSKLLVYWGFIGIMEKEHGNHYFILGLYRNNGKEHGNYYSILGLYRDNGKEHGNYYSTRLIFPLKDSYPVQARFYTQGLGF